MKFTVAVDEREYILELEQNEQNVRFRLKGDCEFSGRASIAAVGAGVYSVLLDRRSFMVHLALNGSGFETVTATAHNVITLADARDRSGRSKALTAAGPMEVKAQMPGKVIKLLVRAGESVESGQGLVVIEAMKMQNEMKSRKSGTIGKIQAREGATVAAGEILMVVE